MRIKLGGIVAIQQSSKTYLCIECNQRYREKPDATAQSYKRKYCSPICARAANREIAKHTIVTWICKQCNSLVKGNPAAERRKYCTDRCYYTYSKIPGQAGITNKVEVLKEGIFIKEKDK